MGGSCSRVPGRNRAPRLRTLRWSNHLTQRAPQYPGTSSLSEASRSGERVSVFISYASRTSPSSLSCLLQFNRGAVRCIVLTSRNVRFEEYVRRAPHHPSSDTPVCRSTSRRRAPADLTLCTDYCVVPNRAIHWSDLMHLLPPVVGTVESDWAT